ncbi:MAG: CarD family transcriptional regulator [Clostridiales Family XIII bacterium]|jgi:CarD family transcriptional regulator|nr:CarD family transcriptional regulator [Clostridiales Family XIII bacterium]
MLLNVNDVVVYAREGLCVITEISEQEIGDERKEYYKLRHIFDGGATIFIPVSNELLTSKIRPVLSLNEIHEIIRKMPAAEPIRLEAYSDTTRKAEYKELLSNGNIDDVVKLIKTLYMRHRTREHEGKSVFASDKKFMKHAEKLLYEEFAYVLGIEPDQVVPYITEQIANPA